MNTVHKARRLVERLFGATEPVECSCGGAWYPRKTGGRITFAVHTADCPERGRNPADGPRRRPRTPK